MTAPPLGRTAADAGPSHAAPCHAAPGGASGRRDQTSGRPRWFRRVACGVAFVAVSVVLLRAQAGGSPSPAKLGQPGKDVSWVPTSEALIEKMFEMSVAAIIPGDHATLTSQPRDRFEFPANTAFGRAVGKLAGKVAHTTGPEAPGRAA